MILKCFRFGLKRVLLYGIVYSERIARQIVNNVLDWYNQVKA